VAFSKLLVNEQLESVHQLNEIVRNTNAFRDAESAGKLIRLPTGDGMALIFSQDPEAPVDCAMEIAKALRKASHLPVRMGIHSGPVSRMMDVNDRSNVTGDGLNVAQRVMSCGDAGHILLSKRAADDLIGYRHWRSCLHEIGECQVKHGSKIALVNLYNEEVGNPSLPNRCKEQGQPSSSGSRSKDFLRWQDIVRITAAVFGLIALFYVVYSVFLARSIHHHPKAQSDDAFLLIPEKSIAVLPFQNLSDDKANAHFADGVQDEILTDLAKVAGLKVISRTSVMQYKVDIRRNLRQIARELGVAHILEGTVQRAGNRLRVSAQLIDARTDSHLWAEHYDRELADVFAIESEVAQQIVSQLQVELSPREKAALKERPTSDIVVYDLYIRAKALVARSVYVHAEENRKEALRLLNQAVGRDPSFLLAYCLIASINDQIYFANIDRTPARLALADNAIQTAFRLRPDSGEAHLALAEHRYFGYLDYDGARNELDIARQVLPNEPRIFELFGYIGRRQGHWAESIRNLERALELDPRNFYNLQQIARSYDYLRRFADEASILNRALTVVPNDTGVRVQLAYMEIGWHADPKPLRSTLESVLREDPHAVEHFIDQNLFLALCERDWAGASQVLSKMDDKGYTSENFAFPKVFCEAVVARARGDTAVARGFFSAARDDLTKLILEEPDYPETLSVLSMVDAGLGRKEDAIKEGRRAVELLPLTTDSINGAVLIKNLAISYAWLDEKDLALEQLKVAARIPSDVTYGELQLHPNWDALRHDARFKDIVASLVSVDRRNP